ncbi:type I polyketide synthase [Polyangium jinanense]|uniref:Acyltransferase domain-containing protein n=1 Tax=Polyangium jinanense TaxID=2829994 RepID=A0A9X3XEX7_9BACT|nr:type I polyketide synthase [Polyangium jinanense]MDC3987763.1 acyltransferase domain-containing protein [Polyangium jinanense]
MSPAEKNESAPGATELFVFSAPSREALLDKLTACDPKGAFPGLAQQLAGLAPEPHRVAIIAADSADLAAKIERAKKQLAGADRPFNLANGAFYGRADDAAALGRTAFLFPGFGAQFPAMLAGLHAHFPVVRAWFDHMEPESRDALMRNPLLFPAPAGREGETPREPDIEDIMNSVLVADLAMYRLVAHLGLGCDAMAGHSFGEIAALLASGMVEDDRQAMRLLRSITRSLREYGQGASDDGEPAYTMLALTDASRKALSHLWTGESATVFLSLDNCPQQAVLVGKPADITRVEQAVRERGEICFRISRLEYPVHTPALAIPRDELRRVFDGIEIGPSAVRPYSCSSAAPFPDRPDEIRDLLAAQWYTPVRLRETIERLHADGVRIFIEVGPGGRLTGFVRDTLRGKEFLALPVYQGSRGALVELQILLAQLFVRGHRVDLPRLWEGRAPVVMPEGSRARETSLPAPVAATGDLLSLPQANRRRALVQLIVERAAEVLELGGADLIDPRRGFFELGMGSLSSLKLVDRLETSLGISIPKTAAFDHPTPEALAGFLSGLLGGESVKESPREGGGEGADLHEPIAIVGVACRLPGGVRTPEAFWDLLRQGRDAITEVPRDRWDPDALRGAEYDVPAPSCLRHGGFLDGIDGFDSLFFGISPLEATTLDPQQRLSLEVTWEALERAGLDPRGLAGSPTGVFLGISNNDYAARLSPRERLHIDGYIGTGNAHSTAAGRIAYVLGLNGPCMAVDTACSSSLVAVHLACQSLRRGESDRAIAGGVSVLLSPESHVFLAKASALAKDGRCKTFDSAADGYVRSEGCVMVVLRRLRDALAAGDEILAVIRGSAVNHDGRTSGFTVPSGPSQEAVVRRALADAGVLPEEVSHIEAHGTGTALGDPIEVRALGNVFAASRSRAPLLLGSVKTNIGHLEAAAGAAGLLKLVLELGHRQIVPHLHLREKSPRIDWDRLPFRIPTGGEPWESEGRPRIAGLSSFGISGTNAHVVLAEAPVRSAEANEAGSDKSHHLLALSAQSPAALGALCAAVADRLTEEPAPDLGDVCYTSQVGRAHFQHRIAVVGASHAELVAALREPPGERAAPARAKTAFLFTGQGSQYVGMGRALFEAEPVFRKALLTCEEMLRPHLEEPLLAVMFGESAAPEGRPLLDRTAYAQPAIFALEYALFELLSSSGIEPDLVLGHSVGEYVAACVAGVFSLEEGLGLIAARGRLMQSLPAGGGMLAVAASEEEVRARLPEGAMGLSFAAVNGPRSVVLSGALEALGTAAGALRDAGLRTNELSVSHAFHSSLMDPILDEFRAIASRVTYRRPGLPLISALNGKRVQNEPTSPEHWTVHLRQPVRFFEAMRAARSEGAGVFLEIGPKAVLSGLGLECLPGADERSFIATLRPPRDERAQFLESLGKLYEHGLEIRWARLHEGHTRRKASLPTYPFQRERYWIERRPVREEGHPYRAEATPSRTLLGDRMRLPGPSRTVRFESHVRTSVQRFLDGYRLAGRRALPGAAYLAMALAAGATLFASAPLAIEGFAVRAPLWLHEKASTVVHTTLDAQDDGAYRMQIFALREGSEGGASEWVLHAEATLRALASGEPSDLPVERAAGEGAAAVPPERFYEASQRFGLVYGEVFRVIEALSVGASEVVVTLAAREVTDPATREDARRTTMLDGCFQAMGAALFAQGGEDLLLESVSRLFFHGGSFERLRVFGAAREGKASLRACEADGGRVVLDIDGIHYGTARALVDEPRGEGEAAGAQGASIVERLRDAPAAEQPGVMRHYLELLVRKILRLAQNQTLDADRPLLALGLDSMMIVQLRARIQRDLGIEIPIARIVERPTLVGLTEAALRGLSEAAEAKAAEDARWVEGEL